MDELVIGFVPGDGLAEMLPYRVEAVGDEGRKGRDS